MKTAQELVKMTHAQLVRLAVKQQVELMEWERYDAGGGDPTLFDFYDTRIKNARRIAREAKKLLAG